MYSLFKKILFQLDPETAHFFVNAGSRLTPKLLLSAITSATSPKITTNIGDSKLKNPVGLAAGFDKNGDSVQFLKSLGFGFLELGSVTAEPSQGNPKPRIFRLVPDQSLINRMGLPNKGAEAFKQRFKNKQPDIPLGINISKTPDFAQTTPLSGIKDYLTSIQKLHNIGSYLTINLSCPNSGEAITFEHPKLFKELGEEIASLRQSLNITKPVLIKLSPDSKPSELKKTVELAIKYNFDGFVLTNTTVQRQSLCTSKERIEQIGKGGLSGQKLEELSNQQLARVYEIVGDKKLLIGVGGLVNFEGLVKKLAAGASLFQIYTGFIYNGPLFIKELNQKLIALCQKTGVDHYSELVGQKDLLKMI